MNSVSNEVHDESIKYYPGEVVYLLGESLYREDFDNIRAFFMHVGCHVIGMPIYLEDYIMQHSEQLYKGCLEKADHVFVINPDGFITKGLQSRIDYAISLGLDVAYIVPMEKSVPEEPEGELEEAE